MHDEINDQSDAGYSVEEVSYHADILVAIGIDHRVLEHIIE